MKSSSILFLYSLVLVVSIAACSTRNLPPPTNTPTDLATATPTIALPLATATLPPASPTLPYTNTNPYNLSITQTAQLGNPIESFVANRQAVVERFEHGVMLMFAQAGNVYKSGEGFIFALASDGRVWRVRDTFVETSKNPDDWYACERKPGLRPERSGIPWRGFGKAWCDNPDIRAALGLAKIYEDVDPDASFQYYERGLAFRLADWKGYPGWKSNQVYVVYYAISKWE